MTKEEYETATDVVKKIRESHKKARDAALKSIIRDDGDMGAAYLREAALVNLCDREIERMGWEKANPEEE